MPIYSVTAKALFRDARNPKAPLPSSWRVGLVRACVVAIGWVLVAPLGVAPLGIAIAATVATGQLPAQAYAEQQQQRFTVKSFRLSGVTLVPEAELQAALEPWLNKPITTLHVQHAARTMAEVYVAHGWPLRPQVASLDVQDGVATLQVVESRLYELARVAPLSAPQVAARSAQAASSHSSHSSHASHSSPASSPPTPRPALLAAAAPGLPSAGDLLREVERERQRDEQRRQQQREQDAASRKALPLELPAPSVMPPLAQPKAGPSFSLSGFRFSGASLLSDAELQAAVAPWLNRAIVFADLQLALNAVAERYRSQGWLARPQLPAQDLVGGVVQVQVLEAKLGAIRFESADSSDSSDSSDSAEGVSRGSKARALATLQAQQAQGEALNINAVERAMQLLNQTPGFRVAATLAAGKAVGLTDVILRIQEQPLLSGQATVDNQGSRSVGTYRASANVVLRNATGWGDETALSAQGSGSGNFNAGLNASVPLGVNGLRLAVQATALRYQLQGEFAAAQAQGSAKSASVSLRYPLGRSMVASLGYEMRRYTNQANAELVSDKELRAVTASVAGSATGSAGLWPDDPGYTQWSLNAWAGELDLSKNSAYANSDAAGAGSAGRYTRVAYSLSRLQPVSAAGSVYLSLSGQLASKNLDSSEKLSLGGANGVRAYPALEASGDSGWLASVEWRYRLWPSVQASVFYDHGQVQLHERPDFAGAAALNRVALKGAGLGLSWAPHPSYGLRLYVARRVGDNPLANPQTGFDSDGSYSLVRAGLSLSYLF